MKFKNCTLLSALVRAICGTAAVMAACEGSVRAATFVPGNLVILRDGTGSGALTSAGTALFLDQYTTAGALVNSVSIPASGPTALVNSAASTTEGTLSLSPNGQYLVFAGFVTNAGVASIASTTAAAAPRAVATVDFGGNFAIAAVTTTEFSATDIRSGTTDANGNFWAVGANSGMNYLGGGTPATIGGTILNSRTIQDIGGNLFYSSGSGTRGVYEVIGTPVSGSTVTNTILATGAQFGTGSSPYAFSFNPGMTVAYVVDSTQYTTTSGQGGIEKWTLVGTNWTYAYTLSYGTNGAFGLAVDFTGANPVIYATSANEDYLFSITDTGVGGTNGATLLVTAAANEGFHGLAWAPVNVTAPPVVTGVTPSSIVTNAGATASFTVSTTGGTPMSYAWYFETATSTNLIAGANSSTLTLPNLIPAASGNYQVVVSNASLQTATSSVCPLAVGGLVVLRDGSGAAALTSAGTALYLDQYTTSGTLVSSQAIPTNGPTALVESGSATSEGTLTRSPNGQYLVIAGYNTNMGVASIASTTSNNVARAVATVDSSGNYILAATTTEFTGNNIRCGAIDGNGNVWAVGANSGVNYLGSGTPATIGGTILNNRVIQDIGGNLYYSSGSGSRGVYEITGTPASGSTVTNTILATGTQWGTGSSPYDFAFNPGMTVAYVADSVPYTNTTGQGGVEKWTLVSGNWTYAYTLSYGTNGAFGLAVDFSGANPVIYATSANENYLFSITDTGAGGTNGATLLATAAANEGFHGLAFAPTNYVVPTAPIISGITPSSIATNAGNTVKFTLTANLGYPAASVFWYDVAGGVTNLVAGATNTALTLANVAASASGNYFAVLTNASGSVTSSVVSLSVTAFPTVSGISPATSTVNAGQTVMFTLTANLGSPAASVFWYQTNGISATLVPGATGATLTLSSVTASNSGGYFAILTNSSGSATSAVAQLTVIDPVIEAEPASVQGLVNGTVQFQVVAAGTTLAYQWYLSDTNGNIIAPAVSLGDGSVISGATTSTLTVANLQPGDVTNFVVVVTNVYGALTSTVASFLVGTNNPAGLPYQQGMLALWDFDGSQFTNTAVNPTSILNPTPFIGSGTAMAVGNCYDPGTSPFSGATDPNDVGYDPSAGAYVFTPYGFDQPSPNFSWGTENYPAVTGTNKANGVQFNVSTVGARNINISYDSRVSSTASDYERLQYTTNGTTWIDYPASSTFSGLSGSGNAGYYNFSYSLVGFPGVDNNPNFGFRVVTEWESTATYGIGTTNFWVGTANSYTSGASGNSAAGTVTYDLVAITGDAITNANVPPVLSSFASTNMVDTNTLQIPFTASSAQMAATNLTFTVKTVDTVAAGVFNQTVNPVFSVVNTGPTNFLLNISFGGGFIPDPVDAAPILVTATDTNGESTAASFLLTVGSINQPPTNTLTTLVATNTLANTALTIPFIVGSARDTNTGFTFSVASDNNTVVPAANIVVGGNLTNGNMTVTITPATNQVGNALISVTVYDNDPAEPRSTTANIAFVVRPNTNNVAVDYFNYDNSGGLDTVASGYWQHLSGINGQLQVGGGVAIVDTADNTENLQAQLVGSPYRTNSSAVLYASFTVNMNPSKLPTASGSYFALFNNGSGSTGPYEGRVVAATNGAAPGFYRLGINNFGASATSGQMYPLDLTPGVNYLVVTKLVLSNGFSTIWINPTNSSAQSVTDTTPAPSPTNLYNIVDFELRESGSTAGSVSVGALNVGTSFDSVFYPAQANAASFAVTENTATLLDPLLIDAGWALSYVSLMPDTNSVATASGTNIDYLAATNFTGAATVGYVITDNLGNLSTNTITVLVTNIPPTTVAATYTVSENSTNDVLSPLSGDAVQTPGGLLSLAGVTTTNGTANLSGTNVLFTPAANFAGTAVLGYAVTDGIGGTNSSTITVNVVANLTPIPVNAQFAGGNLVLSWTNSAFNLEYSTNVMGPYVTIPGATSPYTNSVRTNAAGFFRLVH